jgi:hypothetical protein
LDELTQLGDPLVVLDEKINSGCPTT